VSAAPPAAPALAPAAPQITDDDFTLLGLPQRFALDRTLLDERRRALQAATHPDRFAADGPTAQRLAMQWAVRINEAHQRLKTPLERAAYLCELRGAPIQAHSNTAMPAAFLMQQMQWREALEEAGDAAAVNALSAEVEAFEQSLAHRVARALDEAAEPVAAVAEQVRAWMFVRRFRDDLDARLDAFDAQG
jgi:molecular chaperone HscB